MFGGLLKSTSRLALVAAAAVVGGVSAQAADLGGNCCADLEERVAELEATTARKGNRKVSLTVYGQVNQALLAWDDGDERNAYVVDNNQSRTRFGFRGSAKINSDLTAGYLLEIGVRYASSANRSQLSTAAGGDSNTLDIRHSAWNISSKQFGTVWVGQTGSATDGITEINLSGNVNAGADMFGAWGADGFRLRRTGTTGQAGLSTLTWANLTSVSTNNVGEGDRNNVVKYISPTIAGFHVQAAAGEDDLWDVALRYAGEFNGIRLAGGIGYRQITDVSVGGDATSGGGYANIGTATNSNADVTSLGLSASVMHVPTGLFAFYTYGEETDHNRDVLYGVNVDDEASNHYLQVGIQKNFFGIGNTTVYGEYFTGAFGAGVVANAAAAAGTLGGAARIANAEVEVWGLGIVQSIDAAAMDLYVGYRSYSADITTSATGSSLNTVKVGVEDFQAVIAGGIIRF
jgi:predicted porin